MARRKNRSRKRPKPLSDEQKGPRVLVLEALSGSSRAVRRAGGNPLTANPRGQALKLIQHAKWDALLLTGGSDIDPHRYRARKVNKHVYGVNQVRDHVEITALKEARRRNVPVLGICRGCQMINVEAGGTLRQHIGYHHSGMDHFVATAKDSALAKAAGQQFYVVSLHHQVVQRIAKGFRLVGEAFDKTPEAIESLDGRCLGVQFHPEMDERKEYARAIFRWLVVEAATRAGVPVPKEEPAPKPLSPGWWNSDDDDEMLPWDDRSLVLAAPKNRPAGTMAKPQSPVTYSWVCSCHGIKFDYKRDRDDHERMFGGTR